MQRRPVVLDVEGILITDAKAAYIQSKGVEVVDVFDALAGQPRFLSRVNERNGREEHAMLGRTAGGRFLLVGIERVEQGLWRLIKAYPLDHRRGERIYNELGSERDDHKG